MFLDSRDEFFDQLPDYVLDLLTGDETARVAEHLQSCQACQAESLRLQAAADELPLALVQSAPPARVKDRLMRSIQTRRAGASPAMQPSFWQWLTGSLRPSLPALGAALLVVLVLGNLLLWRQLSLTSHQASSPMRIVSLASMQSAADAAGTLIMDRNGVYGTIVVEKLAVLGADQQYQVWLTLGGVPTSGGVFSVNPDGYASLEIEAPLPLEQYDSVGVSVEPAGGSTAPTGVKVLAGDLTH